MKVLGYVTALILIIVVSACFGGYALSVAWGWFVVDAFGLPEISIPTAIGLTLILNFMANETDSKPEPNEFGDVLLRAGTRAVIRPAVLLGIGWAVTLFI